MTCILRVCHRFLLSLIVSFICTATTEIYTLSLHDALPICRGPRRARGRRRRVRPRGASGLRRSEEHTSELQSLRHLVCRLLLEKKKPNQSSEALLGSADCLLLFRAMGDSLIAAT